MITFRRVFVLVFLSCGLLLAEGREYISVKVEGKMVSLDFEFSQNFMDSFSELALKEKYIPTLEDIVEPSLFIYVSDEEGDLMRIITVRGSGKRKGYFIGEIDGKSRKSIFEKSYFVADSKLILIIKSLKEKLGKQRGVVREK